MVLKLSQEYLNVDCYTHRLVWVLFQIAGPSYSGIRGPSHSGTREPDDSGEKAFLFFNTDYKGTVLLEGDISKNCILMVLGLPRRYPQNIL